MVLNTDERLDLDLVKTACIRAPLGRVKIISRISRLNVQRITSLFVKREKLASFEVESVVVESVPYQFNTARKIIKGQD